MSNSASLEGRLWPFIDEYENVTNITLGQPQRYERSDFICDKAGSPVGIELVQVMLNQGERKKSESDAVMLIQERDVDCRKKPSGLNCRVLARLSVRTLAKMLPEKIHLGGVVTSIC